MSNTSHLSQQAADQKLLDGITKHASAIGTLTIDGKPQTPDAIVRVLQGRIDASKKPDASHAIWRQDVKAANAARADTRELIGQVKQALLVVFASSTDTLADMGLAPRKKSVVKPEVRVQAAVKSKSTRAARGTKGKRQKAAISGDVVGITVTPKTVTVTSPAPAAPVTAPAGSPKPTV